MDEPSSGRTYDPKLGRFLQADPFIQAAGNTQSYNRYSYVVNNPLNKIDPSGYISLDIMKGVRRAFFKMIGPEASQVLVGVGSIFCGPFAPLCAAAGSYDASRANGSSMAEAMHTATYSGVSAAAFNAIGGIGLTPSNAVLASAFVGGAMAYGQGGKFGHGFLSAGIGAAAGAYNGEGVSIQGFVVSSVAGGTASYLTGGKFGNGAATAAFSYAMTWGVKKYGAGGVEEVGGNTQANQDDKVNKSLSDNIRRDENGNLVLDITVGAESGQEAQRDLLVKKVSGKWEGKGGCNFLGFGCNKSQVESLIVNATAVDGVGDITVYSRSTMSVLAPDSRWARSGFCEWACATKGGNYMHINSMSMSRDKYLHEVFHNF